MPPSGGKNLVERKFQLGKFSIGHKFQLFNDLLGQFSQGGFIGHQVFVII